MCVSTGQIQTGILLNYVGKCDKGIRNPACKTIMRCQKVIVLVIPQMIFPCFAWQMKAYATQNAIDELKKIATGVIESNNADEWQNGGSTHMT